MPANIRLRYSTGSGESDAASRKRKGKCKQGEDEGEREREASQERRLATLDIFSGCGGLSEGLQQAGDFSLYPYIFLSEYVYSHMYD